MNLKNISKKYGDKQVITDFSHEFSDGTVTAVMAPSGAGKTTLLRLLLGLEQPDSGTLTGVPKQKSALFQEDRLCPGLSIRKNIRMAVGRNLPDSTIDEVLTALGLDPRDDTPASRLSGGMARRAALARALLYPGQLLVLDEPFNGLDDNNRAAAASTILRYRNGRTLIFVTHRREDAPLLEAEEVISVRAEPN